MPTAIKAKFSNIWLKSLHYPKTYGWHTATICEAKSHDHSHGFRPNRNQRHAIVQVHKDMLRSNLHYVVDIDMKGFFDNMNNGKLLKQLWAMGIRDKKLLLSAMLIAEVAGIGFPEVGTPQGSIRCSPISF